MPNDAKYLSTLDVEREAAKIREEYGFRKSPVDPVVLAKKMGIDVFVAEFDDNSISGVLDRTEATPKIFANQDHSAARRRFTVAHELGHFVLHTDQEKYVDRDVNLFRTISSPTGDNREVQANKFAAALLMPRDMVLEAKKDTDDISSLARIFGVSRAAMGIRLANLDSET